MIFDWAATKCFTFRSKVAHVTCLNFLFSLVGRQSDFIFICLFIFNGICMIALLNLFD